MYNQSSPNTFSKICKLTIDYLSHSQKTTPVRLHLLQKKFGYKVKIVTLYIEHFEQMGEMQWLHVSKKF